MKTSVIEVHDMLSVLSVEEVEKRIGEVLGVESVTVNFAGANATVRFDETRLQIADIKSIVRQRGFEPAASANASTGDIHEAHEAHKVADARPPTAPAVLKVVHGAAKSGPVQPNQAVPSAATSTASAPEPSPATPDAAAGAPSLPADDEQKDKAVPDKS